MDTHKLGKSRLDIATIGLGCMGMSDFYGPAEDEKSIAVIRHALQIGINFFDSADMYGVGRNERLLGRALRDVREQAVIATKFAFVRGQDGSWQGINGKPDYVRRSCEGSLERLGVECIDLYYQHRVDPEVPIEETVGAMAELVKQGKVKHLGLSECCVDTLRRAHRVHPIAAVQSEYSLWSREPEEGMLDACAELGITFVAYSPLGRGFLTGALKSINDLSPDDFRRTAPRFQGGNFDRNMRLVRELERLAQKHGASAAQIALAWVLRHPQVVAIPGTRSIERLEENAEAAQIALSATELAELDRVFTPHAAVGERYPEPMMSMVNL